MHFISLKVVTSEKIGGSGVTSTLEAGSLKMNTALEYSTRVVQEGGR